MALLQAPVVSMGAPLEWKLDSPPPLPPLFSTKQEAGPERKPGSLKWDLQAANQNTRKPRKTGGLVWELDTWDQIANKPRRTGSLVWLPDSSQPSPEDQLASQPTSPQTSAATNTSDNQAKKPFADLGAGVRIGIGEPTYAAVSARLGLPLSPDTSLSLRPTYVIGNSDSQGQRNGQGEFFMPLTIDVFTRERVSVYLGPGFTWNTDSNGKILASINGGIDIEFNERVRLSAGLMWINQPGDSNGRDVSLNTLIYYRL